MSRGRWIEAGLAFVLVAIVVGTALVWWQWRSDDNANPAVREPEPPAESGALTREAADPSKLLAAWERSLIGPYAQTATLTRTRGEQTETSRVRRTVSDLGSLDQVGATAVVIRDGRRYICEIFDPDVSCSTGEPAPHGADSSAELGEELAPAGDYLVFGDPDPRCFLLVFDGPADIGARFGQESTLCFDPDTGALVSRLERTGDVTEELVTDSLSPEVSIADLEPG